MNQLDIKNIGGIYEATAQLENGVNIVQASNFTGKSSFISALQVVMGTTNLFDSTHPLTEGQNSGFVQFSAGEMSHEVTLERSPANEILREGSPVLESDEDQTCARLFAFLDENNPIRSRVREQRDLTDVLQAPLDIEDIDGQIATLRRKRESKEEKLTTAQRAKENIPAVTDAIASLEEELESLRQKQKEFEAKVSDATTDNGSLSDELASRRSEASKLERRISQLQTKISETEEQLTEKRTEKEELDIPDQPEPNAEVEDKEKRIDEIKLQVNLLEDLYQANQRVIEEGELSLVTAVDRSIVQDKFDCWLCGESTTTETVKTRLEALQDKVESLQEEQSTLESEIEKIEKRRRKFQEKKRKSVEIEEEIGDLVAQRDDAERDLTEAKERKSEVEEHITELESELERAETELSEKLTETKSEIKIKEQEIETQQDRLRELKNKREDIKSLNKEIDSIDAEIETLKNRKESKQRELKSEFDSAMATAIDHFAPGFDGARLDIKTNKQNEIESFDLIVARDGRETTIDTLSEAEREIVGIIIAIAGYRTFDVSDRVPLILLDGVTQLAVDNLRLLCEHLSEDTEMLVTTAYPEAGTFDGNVIHPENWETISDEDAVPIQT
jgi:chromosome segregation ATPase